MRFHVGDLMEVRNWDPQTVGQGAGHPDGFVLFCEFLQIVCQSFLSDLWVCRFWLGSDPCWVLGALCPQLVSSLWDSGLFGGICCTGV